MCKKICGLTLLLILLFSSSVYNTKAEEVPVSAHMSESYIVTIPTQIQMSGELEKDYQVTVSGYVLDTTVISVVPDSEFEMTDKFSRTATAITVQESTEWFAEEINREGGTTKSGTIFMDNLKAGVWEGELHFNISLSTSVRPGLYNSEDQLVTPWSQLVVDECVVVEGTTLKLGAQRQTMEGKLVIPEGITVIDSSAFNGCTSLTSIDIPNSVTSIGASAFGGCVNLTSVTIPESVTAIPHHLFYKCTNLMSVTIPNSLTSIGDAAFCGCVNLTSIDIPNSVTTIGNSTFWGCEKLSSVTIPNSVTTIGDFAFYDCTNLSTVTIPNSVTTIGDYAFCDCTNLSGVTIPNSVTTIGSYAFQNCMNLSRIKIPDSVTSIGEYAFCKVPHIYYSGSATGNPWGALQIN